MTTVGGVAFAGSVFMGSFINVMLPLYFFASALNGFGASLLWTSQGILLTKYDVMVACLRAVLGKLGDETTPQRHRRRVCSWSER